MIQIIKTEDIHTIGVIHKDIFGEEFPLEKYRKKSKNIHLDNYIIYDQEIVGYCIGYNKVETLDYYLWMGGILENRRNNGYWSQFIDEIIVMAQKEGYRAVSLATYNHWTEMLRLSIKKGFRIVKTTEGQYGDKIKILLEYTLSSPQEVRIILSNKCNFKCFFCHMEGADTHKVMALEKEKLQEIIYQCRINNCQSITLTGGEPLSDLNKLEFIIEFCNNLNYYPELKIITNGSLINEIFISTINSYRGKLRINISLHSMTETIFENITQTKNQYGKVLKGIELLTKNQIDFRINYVVLKGINDSYKEFMDTLTKCIHKKINKITFLELFPTSMEYTTAQYVTEYRDIKNKLEEVGKALGEFEAKFENEKKIRYELRMEDKRLVIEVFKLTCSVGCKKCLQVKDRTIGPDGEYYPCFLETNRTCGKVYKDMKRAFEEGDIFIQNKIAKLTKDICYENKL